MPRYMGETRKDAKVAGERDKTDKELELERSIAERRQAQLGSTASKSELDPDNGGTYRQRPITMVTGGKTATVGPVPTEKTTPVASCKTYRDTKPGSHF